MKKRALVSKREMEANKKHLQKKHIGALWKVQNMGKDVGG